MASLGSMDDHNFCDYCRSYLANGRLIAGGVHDRRQFCSFVCYDRWHAGEVTGPFSRGAAAAKSD